MADKILNVLFLCTGNSARSILAEAVLDHRRAVVGAVAREQVLARAQAGPAQGEEGADEFAKPGAPVMDFIFTVCDQAAGEVCPVWPGHPVTAHWGLADPAAVTSGKTAQALAFREAFRILEARIRYFLTFQFKKLDRDALQRLVIDAGKLIPS